MGGLVTRRPCSDIWQCCDAGIASDERMCCTVARIGVMNHKKHACNPRFAQLGS